MGVAREDLPQENAHGRGLVVVCAMQCRRVGCPGQVTS